MVSDRPHTTQHPMCGKPGIHGFFTRYNAPCEACANAERAQREARQARRLRKLLDDVLLRHADFHIKGLL